MNKPIGYHLDKIYVLASLKGHHLQTANDTFNYGMMKFEEKEFIEVHNKNEFIQTLVRIADETNEHTGPLLHIEAHGLESEGGEYERSLGIELSNGDQLYWHELRPYLTAINAKSCNNLSLVMATCWGMYVIHDLVKSFWEDILGSKCPFFCFVGPEDGISVDDFDSSLREFYQHLNEYKSLEESVRHMNRHSTVKFRYDTCFTAFQTSIDSFANKQIGNRMQRITENPDLIYNEYCALWHYTYGTTCDINAVISIMNDEQFYVDFINKRRRDFLHIKQDEDNRFPIIDRLPGFENTIPEMNIRSGNISFIK